MTRRHHNQGVVLIYALLVIGLLTAIALTVSIVIINELRLTSSSTDGTLAYYAAESGIEKGLYSIKVKRDQGAETLTNTVDLIKGYGESFASNNSQFNDEQTEAGSSQIINRALAENEIIQVDYYDVDDPLCSNPTTCRKVDSVFIQNSGADDNAWAEVSWIGWDANGLLGTSYTSKSIIGQTDLLNGWTVQLANVFADPASIVGYRLRLRALSGPLSSIRITPYYSLGASPTTPVDLPSQVIVKSVGKRNTFKQALTATVPWRLPLSGLYDYVLFSEGELTKNIILSRAVYSSGVIQVEQTATGYLSSSCANCGVCTAAGWLATSCTATSSCTSGTPFYCSAPASNGYYTLPIPASVSATDELYVSLRYRGTSNSAMVTITDPSNGQVGFSFNPSSAGSTWTTCSLPESFSLGSVTSGRSIMFTNQAGAGNFDVDWYQISSYKIFNDCPTS